MAKFKVGDKARVVYSPVHPERTGEACTIVMIGATSLRGKYRDYAIVYDNVLPHPVTGYWVINEDQLEPLIDTDVGSWSEIEESIGWNPMKQLEKLEQ